MNNTLIRYDNAARALAEAKRVDEILEIKNLAAAQEAYARQAKNRDLEADACEIRLRAVRRLGEIMKAQKETVGLNRGGGDHRVTHEDLLALPVEALAADDCVLFLWVVRSHLPPALELIQRWGFEYKSVAFVWYKGEDPDSVTMGTGLWTRTGSEQCWLATRGNPRPINHDVREVISEKRREHSRKPDCTYERIERLVGGPYLELFARQERAGWKTWGNEVPVASDPPYNAADNFAKSINVAYTAIRERVANGGPGYTPPPAEPDDIPEFLQRKRSGSPP